MKRLFCIFGALGMVLPLLADESADTLRTQQLDEVIVEGRNQRLGAAVFHLHTHIQAEECGSKWRRPAGPHGHTSDSHFAQR